MSQATNNPTPGYRVPSFALEVIDLNAHPDGALLRLIAEGTKARAAYDLLGRARFPNGTTKASRAECSAAYGAITDAEDRIMGTPAITGFGLLAKALFTLEHRSITEPNAANLNWGIGGLLLSVVKDGVRIGGCP